MLKYILNCDIIYHVGIFSSKTAAKGYDNEAAILSYS